MPVVPFLLALADDPGVQKRGDIVRLTVALAIGYDESHLPRGVDVDGWRAQVARWESDGAEEAAQRELDEWVEEAVDENERRLRSLRRAGYKHRSPGLQARDELAAYDAVRAGVPRFRRL